MSAHLDVRHRRVQVVELAFHVSNLGLHGRNLRCLALYNSDLALKGGDLVLQLLEELHHLRVRCHGNNVRLRGSAAVATKIRRLVGSKKQHRPKAEQ